MKTTLVVAAGVAFLLSSVAVSPGVPVTFRVNMSERIANYTFDPLVNHVDVRGSFNGWSAGSTLAPTTSDTNIYEGTFEVSGTAGSAVEYKFVITEGPVWESLGGGVNNRIFTLGSSAQSLPTPYFSDQWSGADTIPFTVQVDMGPQTMAGNFDPAADTVELKGSFNGWGGGYPLTNNPSGPAPNIYSGTFDLSQPAPNGMIAYKFHVYGTPGRDIWESDPNRLIVLTSPGAVAPLDCFNRACSVPIKVAISLNADMNAQMTLGRFDRAADEVWARGTSFGGWGAPPEGLQLFEDTSRPGIYTNYWTSLVSPGAPIEFKFTIWRPASGQTVWEDGIPNRSVTFTGTEPTDAAGNRVRAVNVLFNNVSANDFLSADTLVTFRVDMRNAVGYTGTPVFNPQSMAVWINGTMLSNSWNTYGFWDTYPPETRMVDDGTLGDAVGGDNIWSWQYLVKQGQPIRVVYKYGIDSGDNEAGADVNHARYIRSTGTYVMPLDKFGDQYVEPAIGNLTVRPGSPGYVQLSWSPLPGARLQVSTDLNSTNWQDVAGTEGAASANYQTTAPRTFFRVFKP